jgi:hypothetical protein
MPSGSESSFFYLENNFYHANPKNIPQKFRQDEMLYFESYEIAIIQPFLIHKSIIL